MEIVGDGYLVASGLPKPNGDLHASEISRMALQLMSLVDSFEVTLYPNVTISLYVIVLIVLVIMISPIHQNSFLLKVKHKINYKLRMRMGIHSGACIGSVLGLKMPHFSVFGETVSLFTLFISYFQPIPILLVI